MAAARRTVEALLANSPNDGACLHLAGLVAQQGGDAATAAKFLHRAAKQLPGNANVRAHLGVVLATAGQKADAVQHLRTALELDPQHVDALYNLGNLCHANGRLDEAVELFGRVVRLRPTFVQGVFNWANALRDAGKLQEAADAYEQALRLKPDYLKALNNLGTICLRLGNVDRAREVLATAVELRPDYAEAHFNLGNACRASGSIDEATQQYRQAIEANEAMPKAHAALADLLKDASQINQAVVHYRKAIEHYVPPAAARTDSASSATPRPSVAASEFDLIRVWNNMGSCLVSLREYAEAEASFRYVLSLDGKNAVARNNLGVIRMSQGLPDQARAEFEAAIGLNERYAEAHSNLGAALQNQGKNDEAAKAYERALSFDERLADARWNRSLLWLADGDWERGWPEYEWRWRRADFCRNQYRCPAEVRVGGKSTEGARAPRQIDAPAWDGSPLDGQSVLLFAEQGLGDAIQFIRLARLVKARGARVIAECPPRLLPLLKGCPGVDQWVGQGAALPRCDYQIALMSLPAALKLSGTALSLPAEAYLRPDHARSLHWQAQLASIPGPKIGINWQGNPSYNMDRYRSIPLAEFAPLAAIDGVTLVALQQGFGSEQTVDVEDEFRVHAFDDELDRDGAFVDTAAIMANLDLIVTSDTATAHLAGALGAPTLVVLPAVADWRWGLAGETSLWYANMRLFRQRRLGEWPDVFRRVAAEIRRRFGHA